MKTEVAPIAEPIEELAPPEILTEEAAPIEEPTKETAPAEAPMEDTAPMEEPSEELAAPMAMASGLTEEPAVPPVLCEEKEEGKVPHSSFPGWMEVLHPSQTMALLGKPL